MQGHTLLTTNAAGTNTSTGNGPANTFTYDPFGNILSGSTFPNNTTTNGSYAWAASYSKLTETNLAFTPIPMGARIYLPTLGRFTQVDPIDRGTPNAYVYAVDPVNTSDYSGRALSNAGLSFVSDCRRNGIKACLTHVATIGAAAIVAYGAIAYGGVVAGVAAQAFGLKVVSTMTPLTVVQSPLQKGMAGMNVVGVSQNTQRILSVTGSANYRIPDVLVRSSNGIAQIGEVKNVQYQSYTNQIRDFTLYAQQNNIPFTLYLNNSAGMSRVLQGAVDDGMINLIRY